MSYGPNFIDETLAGTTGATGLPTYVHFDEKDIFRLQHLSSINPSLILLKDTNIVVSSNSETDSNPANTFIARTQLHLGQGLFPHTVKINNLISFIKQFKDNESSSGGGDVKFGVEVVQGATQPYFHVGDEDGGCKIPGSWPTDDELKNGPYSYFSEQLGSYHGAPSQNYPSNPKLYWNHPSISNGDVAAYAAALYDIEFKMSSQDNGATTRKTVRAILSSGGDGFRVYCDQQAATDTDGFAVGDSYIYIESVKKTSSGSSNEDQVMSNINTVLGAPQIKVKKKFTPSYDVKDPQDANIATCHGTTGGVRVLPPFWGPKFSAGTTSKPIPLANLKLVYNLQLDDTPDNYFGNYIVSIDVANKVMRFVDYDEKFEFFYLFEGYPGDKITGRPVLEVDETTLVKNRTYGGFTWVWDTYLSLPESERNKLGGF